MINYQNAKPDNPINYPEVLERIGGDREFLAELLKIYLLEFQEKKSQVEAALEGADFGLIQEIGHSLKGASANLSLPSLRRVASALEIAGRERNIETARQALGALVSECQLLLDFLKQNPPDAQPV
jgi:HPt (histidine-containing phosphotransfer) domain-containing protein